MWFELSISHYLIAEQFKVQLKEISPLEIIQYTCYHVSIHSISHILTLVLQGSMFLTMRLLFSDRKKTNDEISSVNKTAHRDLISLVK